MKPLPPCRSNGECALSLTVTKDVGAETTPLGAEVSSPTAASRALLCWLAVNEDPVPSIFPPADTAKFASRATSCESRGVSLAYPSSNDERSSSLLPWIEAVPSSP